MEKREGVCGVEAEEGKGETGRGVAEAEAVGARWFTNFFLRAKLGPGQVFVFHDRNSTVVIHQHRGLTALLVVDFELTVCTPSKTSAVIEYVLLIDPSGENNYQNDVNASSIISHSIILIQMFASVPSLHVQKLQSVSVE